MVEILTTKKDVVNRKQKEKVGFKSVNKQSKNIDKIAQKALPCVYKQNSACAFQNNSLRLLT